MAILISGKLGLKAKRFREKGDDSIIIKATIHQEDIIILYMFEPKITASIHVRKNHYKNLKHI